MSEAITPHRGFNDLYMRYIAGDTDDFTACEDFTMRIRKIEVLLEAIYDQLNPHPMAPTKEELRRLKL